MQSASFVFIKWSEMPYVRLISFQLKFLVSFSFSFVKNHLPKRDYWSVGGYEQGSGSRIVVFNHVDGLP